MHVSKQSEIFHALQFNLTAWLIDLGAALKIFFYFKLKAEHLRLYTRPSALTSFTGFYKPSTPTTRTKGHGPVFLTKS